MGFHSHIYARAIVPNPQDPAAVDFRAFYPYTPNEVKHRKRTTNQQLKVLETIFKKDTKPNAQLRQDLAAELGMTPRGVQVWFQNRRAKEKSKTGKGAKTALAAGPSGSHGTNVEESSPSASNSPAPVQDESSLDSVLPEVVSDDHNNQIPVVSRSPSSSSVHPTPHVSSPPQLHVRTDASTLRSSAKSPIDFPPDSAASYKSVGFPPMSSTAFPASSAFHNPRYGDMGLTSEDLYSLRRGSLPVLPVTPSFGQHPPQADLGYDPLVRRGSVDASLQRLASNPFAPHARAKNSALYGPGVGVSVPGLNPASGPIHAGTGASTRYHPVHNRIPQGYYPPQRRSLMPAAAQLHPSMPQHPAGMRRFSMDARATRIAAAQRTHHSASPSPLTPYNAAIRASLPEPHLYSVTARPVVSPIPGPLPAPGFQFGAASSASPSSADSERNSPDSPKSFAFGGEDDGETSPPYGYSSRFGSIASIATSESSINSSYYAELGGSAVDHTEQRESSCAPPSQFLGVYSDVDGSNQAENVQHCGPVNTVGLDNLTIGGFSDLNGFGSVDAATSMNHLHQEPQVSGSQTSTYPSPASTISAGGSPGQMPLTTSSSLAFALDDKHAEQKSAHSRQDIYTSFATGEHPVSHTTQDHIQTTQDTYFTQGHTFQQDSPYPQAYPFGGDHLHSVQAQSDYSVFTTNGDFADPLDPNGAHEARHLNVDAFAAYT